jgi:fucose permease
LTARRAGFAAFFLLGWAILLVPSLIRDVQGAFAQGDGAMGIAYLAYNGVYVIGTLAIGLLTVRVGRRRVLPAGPLIMALGIGGCALAPGWLAFVLGFVVFGFGAGIVDSGVNALFMDLYPDQRTSALNRLHLWVAIGALTAPFVVGQLVGAGIAWRVILVATAVGALTVAVALGRASMPSGKAVKHVSVAGERRAVTTSRWFYVPLVALSIAIGCYIATEMGVSSWLVRFLEDAELQVATLALSLFWGGLAAGRLVSSMVGDRVRPVALAAGSSALCGVAIVLAVLIPNLPARVVLFAIAGLAAGPIYPTIMALGGAQYPSRTSLVSGVLAASAVIGSVVYPPTVGLMSEAAGLAVGIVGAGVLALAGAVAIVVAHVSGFEAPDAQSSAHRAAGLPAAGPAVAAIDPAPVPPPR